MLHCYMATSAAHQRVVGRRDCSRPDGRVMSKMPVHPSICQAKNFASDLDDFPKSEVRSVQ
jgi:hypothetical protein